MAGRAAVWRLAHWVAGMVILSAVAAVPAPASENRACATGPGAIRPLDIYLPVDSWVYPAMARLHALGYADTTFLGIKPWTRRSIAQILDEVDGEEDVKSQSQAAEIVAAVRQEVDGESEAQPEAGRDFSYGCEQIYSRLQSVGGLTLRDSYHLGQTIANDFGRPYETGFNAVDGAAGSVQFGRFSLYARGEYQHSPSAPGYSPGLVGILSNIDKPSGGPTPPANLAQLTSPAGPIEQTDVFRLIEANVSYRILNHQISFGKSDHWLASTVGGAFMYSNNAENMYAFQIDRTEPLFIPLLSRLVGPFRYVFFVGSLKGHSAPNDPWMHVEKINFKPTPNVEFGFERSVIWGGKGHEPITLHTFLKSFLSTTNVSVAEKFSRADPGARFSSFEFNWRLPWMNHWVTLYTDSMIHDDVNPIDAPRHAGVRPGLYLARMPGIPRLDVRFEGVNTDPETSRSSGGGYLYLEAVQVQGYTNKGYIMGDAIGREGQGGQAWLTYHLSPMEMVQASFKHNKVATDFIPGGTTQNSFDVYVVKRIDATLELSAQLQHEWWKAPIYRTGQQSDTVATFQITLYPQREPKMQAH